MTTDSEFREQRRSFRCPVSDDRQQADLRWGKRRIGVRVVDESAGGFAVLIPALPAALEVISHPGATPSAETGTPPITDQPDDLATEPNTTASHVSAPKQRLELHTSSGVFDVTICHCKEAEPPTDWPPRGLACESDGRARQRGDSLGLSGWTQANAHPHKASDGGAAAVAEAPTCYRLGLRRVREIEVYELAQGRAACRSPWLLLAKMFPKNDGSMLIFGTLIAILGVAGLLALATGSREAIMRWADDDSPAPSAGQLAADSTVQRGRRAANAATDQLGRVAADVASETADAVVQIADEQLERVQQLIAASPGATAFTHAQVADYLNLRADQQSEIQRIAEAVYRAVAQLETQYTGASRAERSRIRQRLNTAARAKAVQMLDQEQRRRWNQLSPEQ